MTGKLVFEEGEGEGVYAPAEDTWCLADAVQADLGDAVCPPVAVEIGCGSGYVLINAARKLKGGPGNGCLFLAVDKNPGACQATARAFDRARRQGLVAGAFEAVQTDLTAGLARLRGRVGLLLCNPPYVPTPSAEVPRLCVSRDECQRATYAGGPGGNCVIDRVFEEIRAGLLGVGGVAYILLSHFNDTAAQEARMRENGFSVDTVATKKAPGERLRVVRIRKN